MVGGTVIEVLTVDERLKLTSDMRVWVNVQDDHGDTCAVYLQATDSAKSVAEGDCLWWQGGNAFWTRKAYRGRSGEGLRCGVDYDVQIPRIGYSGVRHPAQSMIEQAYA